MQTGNSRFFFISRHLQLFLSRREREVGEKETSCKLPQFPSPNYEIRWRCVNAPFVAAERAFGSQFLLGICTAGSG